MRIKRGDKVVVTTGKDKGKEGKVLVVDRKKDRVIVEGVNMIKKHQKVNAANQKGGIISKEAPIHVSNVMFLYKGKPTKIGYQVEKVEKDGKTITTKKRIAKTTGDVID